MKLTRKVILIAALVLASFTLIAAASSELLGRDVAENGRLSTVSGVLRYDAAEGEWYLDSGTDSWVLHLGQASLQAGEVLKDGAAATVSAFVYEHDMAPVSVSTGGVELSVWGDDGRPSWSGRGNRRNATERVSPSGNFYGRSGS
ncbi:MAG: hypothetical protein KKI09_11670 [Spirochaetes bacterium]|nr:hypothetical protein [Spirochaetota bacterium]MBU0956077.1 hypothetical protein [Spirochaetota bacterium]